MKWVKLEANWLRNLNTSTQVLGGNLDNVFFFVYS